MILIYVTARVVLFKYLGAESLCKSKFLLSCLCVRVCGRSPLPAWSKACVYRRSLSGIAGSISAGVTGVCVCLDNILCCHIKVSVSGRSSFQGGRSECGVSWVWSKALDSEAALAHYGLLRREGGVCVFMRFWIYFIPIYDWPLRC